jgi:hypothetical protein
LQSWILWQIRICDPSQASSDIGEFDLQIKRIIDKINQFAILAKKGFCGAELYKTIPDCQGGSSLDVFGMYISEYNVCGSGSRAEREQICIACRPVGI